MKNWYNKFLVVVLMLLLATGIVACKPKNGTPTDPTVPVETPEISNYFPVSTMNPEKHLKVIEGFGVDRIGRHRFITAGAFQGLMNRDLVNYYLNYPIIKENVSSSDYWLDSLVDAYDLTTETITFTQMIQDYIAKFGNNAGYIIYDDQTDAAIGLNQTRSLTAAINMAAIRGWLPIHKALEDEAISLGLEKKLDVTDKDEIWVFNNYKEEFNNAILIQQRPFETSTLPMVPLRDYAVQNKFFTFFEAGISATDIRFRTNVHEWAKPNMPIMGWGPGDEGGHISFASQFGQFPIPSDFSVNLSVFNADIFQMDTINQKTEFVPITPEVGKHYVAIGRSDGDNISVWANEFPLSSTDFKGAQQGNFAMGWSIQPSLIDIAPGMLKAIYASATEYDHFIAPVSGHGYIYPTTYPDEYKPEWFATFDDYMRRTDLSVVQILDIGQGDILSQNVLNLYASSQYVKGGINLNGNRYAGGRGAVVWSENGKPFVSPRETLWTETKELVAARINSYHKDYTRIEGYTFINLHPWSHTYQDVEWVIDNLDDNVVVVSPDQFIDLISKNVPKVNKTSLDPSGNPLVVPNNPLHNKFLLDAEDWTGNIQFSNGMLRINGEASKTYTLPSLDDLYFEFAYQGISQDSTMDVKITMDSITKTVINDMAVRVSDGLSYVLIPFELYYPNGIYKNKTITVTITLGHSSSAIRIDEVKTYVKHSEDKASAGNIYHDDFDTGLEDWVHTSFEKGAMVKLDNGMMMLDGSDGWTGLFNRDINNMAQKHFVMPAYDQISISLTLSTSDMGTEIRVRLFIDGEVIELSDGFQHMKDFAVVDYMRVLENVAGKNAIIQVEQRDSNQNNGIGEVAFIRQFSVGAYQINPTDNRFDIDLEDWNLVSGNISNIPGFVQFSGNAVLSKTIALSELTGRFSYMMTLYFGSASTLEYRFVIENGTQSIFESSWETIKQLHVIDLRDFNEALSGEVVTLRIETRGTGTANLDRFTIATAWIYDPYNNQFESNVEDWTKVSTTGWENNGFSKDPNWPRLKLTYALNGSVTIAKTYTLLNIENQLIQIDLEGLGGLAGNMVVKMMIGEVEYIIYQNQVAAGRNMVNIYLDQISSLNDVTYAGQEVKVLISITQIEGGAGDAFIWSFVTKSYDVISYDPYDNQFEVDMEDFVKVATTGWENNNVVKDPNWPRLQFTYALNGSVTVSKTYQLPNETGIQMILDLEGSGALAGMLEITMTIGETDYIIYDAQIAGGRNTIDIFLSQLTILNGVNYANQEVTLTFVFTQQDGGAGDAWLWSFVTQTYEIYVFNPFNNTFETDKEDFVLVSKTGWENNGFTKDANWPRLQFTYAINGSVTVSKTYQLPNKTGIQMILDLEGSGTLAGMLEITMTIGETDYIIYDAQIASGRNTIDIFLSQLTILNGVNYANQEVTLTFVFTQQDGGAGDAWLWGFKTESFDVLGYDPLNNTFETDKEDFVLVSKTGWENNGFTKDANWPRLQFTYALNGSVTVSKTYQLPNETGIQMILDLEGSGALAGMLEITMTIGETDYIIYDAQIASGRNTIDIFLSQLTILNGVNYANQEVTLTFVFTQQDGGAGDAWLWSFVTQ